MKCVGATDVIVILDLGHEYIQGLRNSYISVRDVETGEQGAIQKIGSSFFVDVLLLLLVVVVVVDVVFASACVAVCGGTCRNSLRSFLCEFFFWSLPCRSRSESDSTQGTKRESGRACVCLWGSEIAR